MGMFSFLKFCPPLITFDSTRLVRYITNRDYLEKENAEHTTQHWGVCDVNIGIWMDKHVPNFMRLDLLGISSPVRCDVAFYFSTSSFVLINEIFITVDHPTTKNKTPHFHYSSTLNNPTTPKCILYTQHNLVLRINNSIQMLPLRCCSVCVGLSTGQRAKSD